MGIISSTVLCQGHWYLLSQKDKRWNVSGEGVVGGLLMPDDCKKALEKKKKELGDPPDDLEYGYIKN